ncbi:M4 family metallopeptidase [Streptomyces sp. NBC_01341]|uniref:M4 family metallopeptidase n=1 Tax=Streptomyces sp. NBC_01341 TaxID=2903831 RepID=UPI002E0EFBFE|nr:M4 family metallopeptidase [Streptomyces sp. NBC_01341]
MAVIAVSLPVGPASADSHTAVTAARTDVRPTAAPAPRAGALPAQLSPTERAALLTRARSQRATTASQLRLGAKEQLVVKSVGKDRDGTTHTHYERTYSGMPVLGGDLIVHRNPGGAVTGTDMATRTSITATGAKAVKSAASARRYALWAARKDGVVHPSAATPRAVIWAAKGKPKLAWESVVEGTQQDGTPSRLHVITDATSGVEIRHYQDIQTGIGHSQYSGQVDLTTTPSGQTFSMSDSTRGGHETYDLNHGDTLNLYRDDDDVWGDGSGASVQTAGVDAAYGAQTTWDFYNDKFGRRGIRNDGVGATSRTHFGTDYVNAFWDDDCFCMTYGDGEGDTHPLTELDVAGHEMTHGVTSNTAGLIYEGESGGLNEATSDILGTGVEFYADNPADPGDYLIAEKLFANGAPLRYMDRPSKDGSSPDYWFSGLDKVEVHSSSGPANHFFYLLAEGSGAKTINGVSYDSPTADGLSVPGIGRDNALKLWYKALTERFTSTTGYQAARVQTLQAAADLWGQASSTYTIVADTWAAIGVGARPAGAYVTNPGNQHSVAGTPVSLQPRTGSIYPGVTNSATGLPTGLTINATTGLISGTPSKAGTSQVTLTVRDSKNTVATARFTWTVQPSGSGCGVSQLFANPGFESGATAWSQSPGVIDSSSETPARTGRYKAWLGGYGTTHTDTLSQKVTIPASCTFATLTFHLLVTTDEAAKSAAYDKLTVKAGTATLGTWSNLDKSTGYVQRTVDLTAYAGKTVTLTFTGTEDSVSQTAFLIDDTTVSAI